MLCLSDPLLDKPVLSLRSGGPVAVIAAPIFNPHNLKVEGFYVRDTADKQTLILLCQDIREFSRQGYIIDDHDVLTHPEDLVRLRDILELNFELLKKPVETTSKEQLGRVSDYAVETTTMYVQKLYVSQSFLKNLAHGSLGIDRSQIVEITDRRIIVNDLLQATPASASPAVA